MFYTLIRILLLNTTKTRFVKVQILCRLCRGLNWFLTPKPLFHRLFMWILLKRAQSHWTLEDLWTWHILSNGYLPMSLLPVVLISIWIIRSLNTRYSIAYHIFLSSVVGFLIFFFFKFMIIFICICIPYRNQGHQIQTSFVFLKTVQKRSRNQ